MKRIMTCIACPQGCRLETEAEGAVLISVTGNKCARGGLYAKQETEAPLRTLTTCLLTRGLDLKMLPVRTSRPIPKEKLIEAMAAAKLLVVTTAVKAGDVVAADLLGLGADLLACREAHKL